MRTKWIKLEWNSDNEYSIDLIQRLFDLAAIEKIRVLEMDEALLGFATTERLLDEIRTRIEIDGKLQYRTVDEEIDPTCEVLRES